MTFLFLILRTLGPIINFLGIMGFGCMGMYEDFDNPGMWIVGGICGVLGIILGASQWAIDVPPRWFWSKSQSELLETRIGSAIGYGLVCFNIPFAIYFITYLVENVL